MSATTPCCGAAYHASPCPCGGTGCADCQHTGVDYVYCASCGRITIGRTRVWVR